MLKVVYVQEMVKKEEVEEVEKKVSVARSAYLHHFILFLSYFELTVY